MQGSKVMHQSRAGTLTPEEPDELIAHVRVCGGAGWVTTGSTRKFGIFRQNAKVVDSLLSSTLRIAGIRRNERARERAPQ